MRVPTILRSSAQEELNVLLRRCLPALLCLVGLALLPALAADDKPVTLKWKLEKDKPFYQEMTTTTKQKMKVMNSDVNQDQTQTFIFSWTPVSQDKDGNWTIKQKIEGVKMSIDIGGSKIDYDSTKESGTANPLSDFFKQLVGSEFTLTLDKDMKVTKIEGRDAFVKKLAAANPQMEPLLNQILSEKALKEMADPTFASIPNKEVKKGDTWSKDSKLDMGPIGTYDNTYKYTSQGADDKDKKLEKIKVETTLKYTPPTDSGASNPLPFKIKSADLKSSNAGGSIWFDTDKGRIDHSETNLTLKGELQIEIGGQTTKVELNQEQTTKVTTSDKNPLEKKA
jgi:hypothetical protein